jgi:hypothetical protein
MARSVFAALCSLTISFFSISGDCRADDPLAVVRDAFEATNKALTSGTGEGTFRRLERAAGASDWETKSEAKIYVEFAGPKYNLVLEYAKERMGTATRRIIYDKAAIFATRFSDRIHPFGGETDVYAGPKEEWESARPQMADFPFDVAKLPSRMGNIPRLIQNIGADRIKMSIAPNGDYLGEHGFANAKGKVVFECPRDCGYNIARTRVLRDDHEVGEDVSATWKKSGDVWYIAAFTEELNLFNGSNMPERSIRDELVYEKFDANPEVPAESFSLTKLSAPLGSRIIDRRSGTAARFRYMPADKELEIRSDGMVTQLETLSTTRPIRPPAPRPPQLRSPINP